MGVEVLRLAQSTAEIQASSPGESVDHCGGNSRGTEVETVGRVVQSAQGNSTSRPGHSAGSVLPFWCGLSFLPPVIIAPHLLSEPAKRE